MKVIERKVVFKFSEEEREALEKVRAIFRELGSYCSTNHTTIYLNSLSCEYDISDFCDESDMITDLLDTNYDAS